MAYIECDLDHKVPSIYDTLDIESKNTLDMTYIKGYSFPVCKMPLPEGRWALSSTRAPSGECPFLLFPTAFVARGEGRDVPIQ